METNLFAGVIKVQVVLVDGKMTTGSETFIYSCFESLNVGASVFSPFTIAFSIFFATKCGYHI